jgi:hypothetical protein
LKGIQINDPSINEDSVMIYGKTHLKNHFICILQLAYDKT